MTVAGETEFQAQSGKIAVVREKIESTREPQAQLVAIQRQTFDLLENLREIDRRAANFGSDFGKSPAAAQIAGEHQLNAVDEALTAETCAGGVGRTWAEGALQECQREALGLERLGYAVPQAVTEQGH